MTQLLLTFGAVMVAAVLLCVARTHHQWGWRRYWAQILTLVFFMSLGSAVWTVRRELGLDSADARRAYESHLIDELALLFWTGFYLAVNLYVVTMATSLFVLVTKVWSHLRALCGAQ